MSKDNYTDNIDFDGEWKTLIKNKKQIISNINFLTESRVLLD